MFDGLDVDTLWQMKNQPNGAEYRVIMHSFGLLEGPTVTFDFKNEMKTYSVDWIRENMQPVI
ncbi:hypothetical protein ACM1ZW_20695 [Pseudomonas sp. NFX71]|uniref:hypothetical protein n=1 Tax=Pseudomonas sp. NFX71 TaxID=3399121 RepID=UPI003A85A9B0